jgi:amino acid permease
VVIYISFFCACLTYTVISSLGFLTFGSHAAGFILDNYSYRDQWASVSRFGIALSVIFAYPLLFLGGRDGCLALLQSTGLPQHQTIDHDEEEQESERPQLYQELQQQQYQQQQQQQLPQRQHQEHGPQGGIIPITFVLLGTITWLAIYIPDLTFVLAFSGATLSSCIIYIFPPLMFQALVLLQGTERLTTTYPTQHWDIQKSQAMLCLGVVLGVAGAVVTVIRTFG